MADEPVAFRVRRGPAAIAALCLLVTAYLGVTLALDPFKNGRRSPELQRIIGVLGAIACGSASLQFAWLAYRRPVGLRLDQDGVSGYYLYHSLAWSEFAELGRSRSNRFGEVKLRAVDHVAGRFVRTDWWRITNLRYGRWHVVIPAWMIGLTRNELVALLRQWHKQYG